MAETKGSNKKKSKIKLPKPEDVLTKLANKDYGEPLVELTEDSEKVESSKGVPTESNVPTASVVNIMKRAKSVGGVKEDKLFDPTKSLPNKDEYFRGNYFEDIPVGLYNHIKTYKKVPKKKYQQIYFAYGQITVGSGNRKDALMSSINQLGASFEELTVSKDKYVDHLQGLRKAAKCVKSKIYKFVTIVKVDSERGTFTSKGKNIFSCASPSQITVDGITDLRQLRVNGSIGMKVGKNKRTITGEILVYMVPITSKVLYEREVIIPGLLPGVHEAFGTSI